MDIVENQKRVAKSTTIFTTSFFMGEDFKLNVNTKCHLVLLDKFMHVEEDKYVDWIPT